MGYTNFRSVGLGVHACETPPIRVRASPPHAHGVCEAARQTFCFPFDTQKQGKYGRLKIPLHRPLYLFVNHRGIYPLLYYILLHHPIFVPQSRRNGIHLWRNRAQNIQQSASGNRQVGYCCVSCACCIADRTMIRR